MLSKLYLTNLKVISRERGALIFTLAFPLFMGFLFGASLNANLKPLKLVAVVSEAPSAQQFVENLKLAKEESPGSGRLTNLFEIQEVESETQARVAFKERRIDGALLVPDLTPGAAVTFLYDEKSPEKYFRAIALVEKAVQGYNLASAGVTQGVSFEASGLRGEGRAQTFDAFLPGLLMFTVMYSSLGFGAGRIVQLRETGAFKRMMVTPLRPKVFMSAELLARATVATVQTFIVLILATQVYDAQIKGAAVWIFLLAIAGAMFFVSLGFTISANSENPTTASGIASVLGFLLIMLGGTFPTTFLPDRVVKVLAYFPVSPIGDAMRAVILDGKSPVSAAPRETLIVAIWVTASLVAAFVTFRFRQPSRKR